MRLHVTEEVQVAFPGTAVQAVEVVNFDAVTPPLTVTLPEEFITT